MLIVGLPTAIILFFNLPDRTESIDGNHSPPQSAVAIDFAERLSTLSEEDIKTRYNNIEFICEQELPSRADKRYCINNIARVNDLPARAVAFFFEKDRLMSVGITLAPDAQIHWTGYMNRHYQHINANLKIDDGALESWVAGEGLITLDSERSSTGKEMILMWKTSPDIKKLIAKYQHER